MTSTKSFRTLNEFECWWYIPDWDVAVCTPPRCGSSTMLAYFAEAGIFVHRPFIETPRSIMIVRDPVSRFISLWKHKCRDGMGLTVGDDDTSPIRGLNPRELIEFIETTDIVDPHWATLTELEGGHSTEIMHYSKINEFLGCEPQVYNKTDGVIFLGKNTTERVKAHYAADYDLL